MVSFVDFGLYFMFIVKTTSGLSCFTETCHPPTTVCKVGFQHGYPSTGSCDKQHQHGNHPQCGHVLPDHGHCHCDDSFCVNLVYSLTTTAMSMPSTTPSPIPSTTPSMVQTDTTMAAPTTTQVKTTSGLSCFTETCHPPTTVCKVGFQHGYPSTGSCDKQHQHGNHPQCGHVLPDHGHCHCDDSFCVNLVYSLTTTAMSMPSTTPSPIPSTTPSMVQTDTTMAAPTTTQAPSSLACTDDEDVLFTCQSYQDSYGLCSAAFGTLLTIAKIRCPKFCGLCGSNVQPTPSPSTVSGSSTLHPCLDHHVKCADPIYQGILCTATLQSTKDYAIATCPKSCNLCTEYFASLAAPVG